MTFDEVAVGRRYRVAGREGLWLATQKHPLLTKPKLDERGEPLRDLNRNLTGETEVSQPAEVELVNDKGETAKVAPAELKA